MFGTLYRFEVKKILSRPYVLLLLVLMVGITICLNVRGLWVQEEVAYVEEDGTFVYETVSRYEAIQLERRFSQEDTGALLDNEAALEMREMNEYYRKAGFRAPTFVLLNRFLVYDGMAVTFLNPLWDETDRPVDVTYQAIEIWQDDEYQSQRLTQEEIAYWQEERAEISTPPHPGLCQGVRRNFGPVHLAEPDGAALCVYLPVRQFLRRPCVQDLAHSHQQQKRSKVPGHTPVQAVSTGYPGSGFAPGAAAGFGVPAGGGGHDIRLELAYPLWCRRLLRL